MTKFLQGVHTTNEPSWVVPLLPNKSNVADGGHLEFWENVNNSGLDIDLCTKDGGKMQYGHAEMTT